MRKRSFVCLILSGIGFAGPAAAQEGGQSQSAASQAADANSEALSKGDSAYLARDFDAAIAAFKQAIAERPQDPMGHYRLGQAQVKKGDLKEAQQSYEQGLRFAAEDARMKLKFLFVLADLEERNKSYDAAAKRWTDYESFATATKDEQSYPGTAAERKKRIAARKQLLADYDAVKKRIAKRLEEAEKKAKEQGSKP